MPKNWQARERKLERKRKAMPVHNRNMPDRGVDAIVKADKKRKDRKR